MANLVGIELDKVGLDGLHLVHNLILSLLISKVKEGIVRDPLRGRAKERYKISQRERKRDSDSSLILSLLKGLFETVERKRER